MTPQSRRTRRHSATRAEIVAAAWSLVREHGLAGLAMRDLGARVDMTAQSLYSYFGSKHAIYDAMFREGYEAFFEAMIAVEPAVTDEAKAIPKPRFPYDLAHAFFDFCTSDPVRYQLLFQRTIPDFVPSEESYAIALRSYEELQTRMSAYGFVNPSDFDLATAVLTGLTSQQIANDPGGNRWKLLVDRAVDMLMASLTANTAVSQPRRKRT